MIEFNNWVLFDQYCMHNRIVLLNHQTINQFNKIINFFTIATYLQMFIKCTQYVK